MACSNVPANKVWTQPQLADVVYGDPTRPIILNLSRFVDLDELDAEALRQMCRRPRVFSAKTTLIVQNSEQDHVCLILSGIAFRYHFLEGRGRQIFSYLLPGDVCDPHFLISPHSDYGVDLLSDALVAYVPVAELMSIVMAHPRIERAVLRTALLDAAMVRECLVNVGQRGGIERMAHFFCEIVARLRYVGGQEADGSIAFPVTHREIADTLGMTPMNVHRVLQHLRRAGVIAWQRHRLTVLDANLLEFHADFDPGYLHLMSKPTQPRLAAYGSGLLNR